MWSIYDILLGQGEKEVGYVQTLFFQQELFLVLLCQFLGQSVHYSWNLPIQTRLFRISHNVELKTIWICPSVIYYSERLFPTLVLLN